MMGDLNSYEACIKKIGILSGEKQGKTVGIEHALAQRPMKGYCMFSLLIHAVLISLIVIVGSHKVHNHPAIITVDLNTEVFTDIGAGRAGGDGKTPGSQAKDKGLNRKAPKAKRQLKAAIPGKVLETPHDAVPKETEADNAIPSNDASDLVLLGRPLPASSSFDMQESGIGFGGGGTGVGGYGSGSGFGGIGKDGTGGTGKGYGMGAGISDEYKRMQYLREHFQYIRELIMKNLTYPLLAKKMGWKGQVTVAFVITERGSVERIRVVKGSGYTILDENVVDTIREVQPFPKPPVRAEIVIPVVYKLG